MTSYFDRRDPAFVARWLPLLKPPTRLWHRSVVRGLERLPDGGALLVSNHSGGAVPMDVPVFAAAAFDRFGTEYPLYVLTHDIMFRSPLAGSFHKAGMVPANREVAHEILTRGGHTIVFPGGDNDVHRPSSRANVIDFFGRTGYVRTAVAAGVPIVPIVSIGGHENQLYLVHSERLGRLFMLDRLFRTERLPITLGFPFGVSAVLPPNLPLPTKIVTQVLDPIDIAAEFGDDPDVAAVDRRVRRVMQAALDELAGERRFPVLG